MENVFVFPTTTNHLCEHLHRVDFLKETMILHRFRMALLGYLVNSAFGKNSNQSSAEFHLPRGKGSFSSFLAQAVVGSHLLLSVSVHMRQECTGMELVAVGSRPSFITTPFYTSSSSALAGFPDPTLGTPPLFEDADASTGPQLWWWLHPGSLSLPSST